MAASVSNATPSIGATLDRLRESGADRLDRVRFHLIEALHRRAAGQTGEARRVLDARLETLLTAYAEDRDGAALRPSVAAPEPVRSALAALLDDTARAQATCAFTRGPHAYPELKVLDDFRQTWSKVSAEKQLRQSLDQVPTNAGPLNSSSLVHRSLSLMRDVSPEYLRQFLSYVDALSWLEQMSAGVTPTTQDASTAKAGRKPAKKQR